MTTEVQNLPVGADAESGADQVIGLLAEYEQVDDVVAAARGLRGDGFTLIDVHSPFPIHGIDHVLGTPNTRLPWLVLGGGLIGLLGGFLLQWYCNAFDYPYFVSNKPMLSFAAYIPIMFEMTVLVGSLTAVFGMLGLNRLPTLYNPLFKSERFRRVTADRFFIAVDATDPLFDEKKTAARLKSLGALAVETVED